MYEVIRPIAAGHQGIVELARAPDGELVALKRLTVEGTPAERSVARQRMRREAELLQAVDAPGVINLLDIFEDDHHGLTLVMPYLAGGSLHDRVRRSGPIPPHRLGELADPLLRAVAAIHRRGIVHRDIKPANILFDEIDGGRPHLIDFGIGSARDFTVGLSNAAELLGTPGFIAPERARGEEATPASDIYSLGATLRFALSGMPPHGVGDVVTMVGRAAAGQIEPLPSDISPHIVAVLDRMCAADPNDRPRAAELLPGPEGTWVSGPVGATHGRAAPRQWPRRRRVITAVAAVALLTLGVLAGFVAANQLGVGTTGAGNAAAESDLPPAPAETTTSSVAPTTTVPVCDPQPYQGCDDTEPAPNTDGAACLEGFFDHDEDPSNGCEAVADDIDDTRLTSGRIQGTIIPVGDVDKVLVPVTDRWQLFCDGVLTLSLTAPAGLDLEMRIYNRGNEIAVATADGGQTTRARLPEPSCAQNDSTTLEVVIRATAGRSSEPWTLERSGSW